jgi:hypothetical protein
MQHVFALAVSGAVTTLLGIGILYFDYGFWHERYSRNETATKKTVISKKEEVPTVSPGQMLGGFLKEASVRIEAIKNDKIISLDGKEIYSKEQVQNTTESRLDTSASSSLYQQESVDSFRKSDQ